MYLNYFIRYLDLVVFTHTWQPGKVENILGGATLIDL